MTELLIIVGVTVGCVAFGLLTRSAPPPATSKAGSCSTTTEASACHTCSLDCDRSETNDVD